ncbi:hypothetical protein F4677DRAFT_458125 [Hypoxylon crocopeplum]|nr:hypothetical protein F4677DRAFT_458125 [Hypoxylon crocopeplum]
MKYLIRFFDLIILYKSIRFFSNLHSPSSPRSLLISENLFHNIKTYFENTCRKMNFDDYGNLLASNGAKLDNALCSDFDSYCFTVTMLVEKGLHVEFRRALSKASALVTSSLCDYIKRMSAKESISQAMAQIWKCTTDVFDSELGTDSRFAVSVRLDYIKRVVTNQLEEERLLRDLLAQLGGIPRFPTPRVMLNLAHILNKQGRHDEAEDIAQDVLFLLQDHEIYAGRIVEKIESLKIVSRGRFEQGQTLAAEQTMREAIRIIVDQWGMQHSWVPEFMSVLEGWFRVWGWEENANTLRGEIEELMGKDEIDE